jgi:hypothetical protein
MQVTRGPGRGGRVIDKDCRSFETLEGAVSACSDGTQIGVISNAGKDKFLALRRLAGGRRAAAAELCDPSLRPRRRAIINRDLMALRLEMPGHGVAHNAKTKERYSSHVLPSARAPVRGPSLIDIEVEIFASYLRKCAVGDARI